MKHSLSVVVILVIVLDCRTSHAQANVISNPSFEERGITNKPRDWNYSEGDWFSDSNHYHSGRSSLCLHKTNSAVWSTASQVIEFRTPPKTLRFGSYVRASHVVEDPPNRNGISMAINYYTDDGKWERVGVYSLGAGSFDWKYFWDEFPAPEGARKFTFELYMDKGTTGSAWFDDVALNSIQ